jgi:pimeloyl-ACP methyl ester carboxylesterase
MQLNYKKIGEGQPLLIIHGLFGTLDNWMTMAKKIAEQHFAVYLIDLRNHGQSPHDAAFNYEVLAADVVSFITQHQLKDVLLMGHSLGGKTAMKVALQFPELIKKLIVVDIGVRYYAPHHTEILAALNSLDLDVIKSRAEAEQVLSMSIADFATRQFLLKNLYWKTNTQLAWRFNLTAIEKHIEEVGKQTAAESSFNKPTLFIRGEKSNYIKDEDAAGINLLFPQAILITAPNAGHWVHADAPQWMLEKVLEFISI